MVLSSMQLQKVSVTLWFRRLQCLVLRSVLSVFSTCVLQSVCVHSMDFVSAINKQIKNKINKKGEQLRNAEHEQVVYTTLARASICKLANTTNPMRGQSIQHMRPWKHDWELYATLATTKLEREVYKTLTNMKTRAGSVYNTCYRENLSGKCIQHLQPR